MIYKCFENLRESVCRVVALDLQALRMADLNRSDGDDNLFSASHIKSAMSSNGRDLKYFTVPLLLRLLELFAASRTQASSATATNVFLGADFLIELKAMTVEEGLCELAKHAQYRDVLISSTRSRRLITRRPTMSACFCAT